MKSVTSNAEHHIDILLHGYGGLVSFEPCAGAFLDEAGRDYLNRARLGEIAEGDPAMAAKVFSLARQHGISFDGGIPNASRMMLELPESALRQAVFSLRPCREIETAEGHFSFSEWIRYMVAIALASRELGIFALPEAQRPMAYWAGLLCEMGNLALADLMPKSFLQMVWQAQMLDKPLEDIQDEHLNTNAHIIARRLGQQWGFSEPLVMTLWLTGMAHPTIQTRSEYERCAKVVRAGAQIARRLFKPFALGRNLSARAFGQLCDHLDLHPEQIEHVTGVLPEQLEEVWVRCTGASETADYQHSMRLAGAALARENSKLNYDRRPMEQKARLFEFTSDILNKSKNAETVLEAAEKLGICWRTHFQTGRTAVVSLQGGSGEAATAVGISATGEAAARLLSLTPRQAEILQSDNEKIAPKQLSPAIGELLTQIWEDADPDGFLFLAFQWEDENAAGILFEPGYPVGYAFEASTIAALSSVIPGVLTITQKCQNRMRLAEDFSTLVEKLERSSEIAAAAQTFAAIAEFSAGAAHELNNPLAVISGRAQLLNETEQDPERKRILDQIQQRSHEISGLIGELMTFAKPEPPSYSTIPVSQLIDQAWEQVCNQGDFSGFSLEKEDLETLEPVYADSSQVRLAFYHLLMNAAESLNGQGGRIEVRGEAMSSRIVVSIIDRGEGMDPRTVEKAFEPFFSSKTAGRKRGLGLAIARRLIELNGGSIRLESHLGSGTRALVTLKMPPGY